MLTCSPVLFNWLIGKNTTDVSCECQVVRLIFYEEILAAAIACGCPGQVWRLVRSKIDYEHSIFNAHAQALNKKPSCLESDSLAVVQSFWIHLLYTIFGLSISFFLCQALSISRQRKVEFWLRSSDSTLYIVPQQGVDGEVASVGMDLAAQGL